MSKQCFVFCVTAALLAVSVLGLALPTASGRQDAPLPSPTLEITPPPPAPLAEDSDDIMNIVLLGSDTTSDVAYQTDVIIVVSVNRSTGSVALWHVPRDLLVFIPGHRPMDRINRAYGLGVTENLPGGGPETIKQTFLYNFGLKLDHYALVNFTDFTTIISELGGLEISIDCGLQDWRLKSPELDPAVEENWELYTLPMGFRVLTPDLALWYVRSRVTTNDLDRGRRQMDVLRAIAQQSKRQGLLNDITDLWPRLVELVDTDMTLNDALSFAPLAISLHSADIARYSGEVGVHYTRYLTNDNGRDVLLPNREALLRLVADLVTPPTDNRLARRRWTVEIVDTTRYYGGFDYVAANRLAWEGFEPSIGDSEETVRRELTVIYDYTGQTKGSPLPDLQRLLRVDDAQVVIQPDPNRKVDFRVEIGMAYQSCVQSYAEADSAAPTAGE